MKRHFQLQNGSFVANGLRFDKKCASERSVNGDTKRMRISSAEEKPTIQPQRKNDLQNTGETKIQTIVELTRMLVHSEGLKIKPVNSIREVAFTQDVHLLMKNQYRETYKSQAYAW